MSIQPTEPIQRTSPKNPRSTRKTLASAFVLMTVAPLVTLAGCYEGLDRLGEEEGIFEELADARLPLEFDHLELFDAGEQPRPPLGDDAADWDLSDPDDVDAIYGGTTVPVCGWPATVSLGGSCTGSLVHPEVVIYAGHCGASYSSVAFGESIHSPAKVVATTGCAAYPGWKLGEGNDFAVCRLAQPVNDVPITPILMGCEAQILQPGKAVTLAGFGHANNGPYGIKRHVTTTINQISNKNEISIGGGGKDTCQGDSGGPAYVQLNDGTWRVFGITSYGGACGNGGWYSMMHIGMPWFEQVTGIDLTPCHTANGAWSPSAQCGSFPQNPSNPGGTWGGGCNSGPLSGYSQTCGAPFQAPQPEPEPEPEPNPAPCVNCTKYTGSLSGPGATQLQPAGNYYHSNSSGWHEGYLQGPPGSDYDLYLYRWNGNGWAMVAKRETASTNETIKYSGTAGYYIWMVASYSGSGSYDFWLKKP